LLDNSVSVQVGNQQDVVSTVTLPKVSVSIAKVLLVASNRDDTIYESHPHISGVAIGVGILDTTASASLIIVIQVKHNTLGVVNLVSCVLDKAENNICKFDVTLPSIWFSAQARITISAVGIESSTISYGLSADPAVPTPDIGTLLIPLPFAEIPIGEAISIPLWLNSGKRTTQTVSFFVTVGAGVSIEGLETNTSIWLTSVDQPSEFVLACSFVAQPLPASVSTAARTGTFIIAYVRLRISGAHSITESVVVSEVKEWTDSSGANVRRSGNLSPTAMIVSRSGTLPGSGTIAFPSIDVVWLSLSTTSAVILNTAVISNQRAASSLSLTGVTGASMPTTAPIAGARCESSNPGILKVATDCSEVFVDGTEVAEGSVVITALYLNAQASVLIDVLLPTSVYIRVSDSVLQEIVQWPAEQDSATGCAPRYQSSRVFVFARFDVARPTTSGIAHLGAIDLDVTGIAVDVLSTPDTEVVVIDTASIVGSAFAHGVAVGTAEIRLSIATTASTVVSGAFVSVTSESTHIVGFHAVPIVSLELTMGASSIDTDLLRLLTLQISVVSTLSFPFESAYIATVVQFDDGTQHPIPLGVDTLRLTSLDGVLNILSDNHVSTASSATGQLQVDMVAEKCTTSASGTPGSAQVIASSTVWVTALYQQPSQVTVSIPHPTLTLDADLLAPAGLGIYPTSTPIQVLVTFTYPNGSRITLDWSNSRFLSVSLNDSTVLAVSVGTNGVWQVGVKANAMLLVASSHAVAVVVGLQDFQYTGVIQVVAAEGLEIALHPYPVFPGSVRASKRTINPLGSSGIFQRAQVLVSVGTTTGALFDITTHPLLAVTATFDTAIQAVQPYMYLNSQSGFYVIGCNASVSTFPAIPVTIRAAIDTFIQTTVLVVSSSAVFVNGFEFELPNVLSSTHMLGLDVKFSDGTQLLDFFGSGHAAVPNLVQLKFSEVGYATVSNASGIVQAIGNTYQPIALRASVRNDERTTFTQSYSVTVNLVAELGDMDLGSSDGALALAPVHAGDEVEVPVTINTGIINALAVQLLVRVPVTVGDILSVQPGSDWLGAGFYSSVDPTSGEVQLGGLSGSLSGARAEAAKIRIKFHSSIVTATAAVFECQVVALSDADGNVIGSFEGRSSWAASKVPALVLPSTATRRDIRGNVAETMVSGRDGDVDLMIASQLYQDNARRRSTSAVAQTCLSELASNSSSVSASSSSAATYLPGDADGNCEFNLRDAALVQTALTKSILNSTYMSRYSKQRIAVMDADQSGVVSLVDVSLLVKIAFNALDFFHSVTIGTPSDANDCKLSVAVHVLTGAYDVPDPSTTYVIIGVHSLPQADQTVLASLLPWPSSGDFTAGTVVTWSHASAGTQFWLTEFDPTTKSYFVSLNTSLPADIDYGLTVILVSTVLLYAIDVSNSGQQQATTSYQWFSTAPGSVVLNAADFASSKLQLTPQLTIPLTTRSFGPLETLSISSTSDDCVSLSLTPAASTSASASSWLLLLLLLLLLVPIAILIMLYKRSQRIKLTHPIDFKVRVASKLDTLRPDQHPLRDDGCQFGYELSTSLDPSDYVLGRELWLVRHQAYTFEMEPSVTHDYPFYISRSDYGGGNGFEEYTEGVVNSPTFYHHNSTNNRKDRKSVLQFAPGTKCPKLLYYQCVKQKSMGYKINIVDSPQEIPSVDFTSLPIIRLNDDEIDADRSSRSLSMIPFEFLRPHAPIYYPPPAYSQHSRLRDSEPEWLQAVDSLESPLFLKGTQAPTISKAQTRLSNAVSLVRDVQIVEDQPNRPRRTKTKPTLPAYVLPPSYELVSHVSADVYSSSTRNSTMHLAPNDPLRAQIERQSQLSAILAQAAVTPDSKLKIHRQPPGYVSPPADDMIDDFMQHSSLSGSPMTGLRELRVGSTLPSEGYRSSSKTTPLILREPTSSQPGSPKLHDSDVSPTSGDEGVPATVRLFEHRRQPPGYISPPKQ
jgi:hypothetical protein